MKVKLLVSRAGMDFSQVVGEVIEVSEQEAMNLIKANQAEPIQVKKETASKKTPVQKRAKK